MGQKNNSNRLQNSITTLIIVVATIFILFSNMESNLIKTYAQEKTSTSTSTSTDRNKKKKQNLCFDKAYHSKEVEQEIIKRGYNPHIRNRREEKLFRKKHPARRWVVERTNSWRNRFRKLFTRYEKKEENYLGLVQLANTLIVYRMIILDQRRLNLFFIRA